MSDDIRQRFAAMKEQRAPLPSAAEVRSRGTRRRIRRAGLAAACALSVVVAILFLRPTSPQVIGPPPVLPLCQATDFDPRPQVSLLAGPAVTVRLTLNRTESCRMTGYPVMVGQRERDATRRHWDFLQPPTTPHDVKVHPGQTVGFSLITRPSTPVCPATFTYRDNEMIFNGGQAYALAGVEITWNCDMDLEAWEIGP